MQYSIVISDIEIEGKTHITYGIAGKNISVSDVSTDKAKVEEMVKRINAEQLEECHLMEFIQDELA